MAKNVWVDLALGGLSALPGWDEREEQKRKRELSLSRKKADKLSRGEDETAEELRERLEDDGYDEDEIQDAIDNMDDNEEDDDDVAASLGLPGGSIDWLLAKEEEKKCEHMNADDSFKGGFSGCVLHMQNCEGHSEESAKAICGKIAKDKELSLAGNPYHDEKGRFSSGEGASGGSKEMAYHAAAAEAHKDSAAAIRSNTKEAHNKAADSHKIAASIIRPVEGNSARVVEHSNQFAKHQEMARNAPNVSYAMSRKNHENAAHAIGQIPDKEERKTAAGIYAKVAARHANNFDSSRFQAAVEKHAAGEGKVPKSSQSGLSRQHYQGFADEIKQIPDKAERAKHAETFAKISADGNPGFKPDRFKKAAGVSYVTNDGKKDQASAEPHAIADTSKPLAGDEENLKKGARDAANYRLGYGSNRIFSGGLSMDDLLLAGKVPPQFLKKKEDDEDDDEEDDKDDPKDSKDDKDDKDDEDSKDDQDGKDEDKEDDDTDTEDDKDDSKEDDEDEDEEDDKKKSKKSGTDDDDEEDDDDKGRDLGLSLENNPLVADAQRRADEAAAKKPYRL